MFDTSAQISKNKAPCAEKRHSAEADVSQRLATDSGCELESYQQAADSGALGFVRWSLKPRLNLRRAIRGSQATHIEAVKLRVSRRGKPRFGAQITDFRTAALKVAGRRAAAGLLLARLRFGSFLLAVEAH